MNRRNFGLMAGTSVLALMGARPSRASTADPSLLDTPTLTPVGAERAGNAAGTIPAWTGGMTSIPDGIDWDPTKSLAPDFFASDQLLYKVDASNLAQYAAVLSEGTQKLITDRGFYLNVYPTRRTAALPQWVYDNTKLNVTRTTPQSGDYRFGFNGAYGGVPFPLPDSDPMVAGPQIIWNSLARWSGPYFTYRSGGYTVANGAPVLATNSEVSYWYYYFEPNGSPETFNGLFYSVFVDTYGPATSAGQLAVGVQSLNNVKHEQMSWTLLAGQGRVRRTPNLMFDTPSSYGDGIYNYDESGGFNGPIYKYDWKFLGKQEMLIPYNCNKMATANSAAVHLKDFFDPTYTRWELHRCWVVEATLHPGQRNVMAKRRMYVDEDDWSIHITDTWDGAGNPFHVEHVLSVVYPNLPGSIYGDAIIYNLQTGQYVSTGGAFADPPYNQPYDFSPKPASNYDPNAMAAMGAY